MFQERIAKPAGVRRAELLIWAMLGASGVVSAVDVSLGRIDDGQFGFSLIMYAILCIVPYKIGRRSNAARHIYAVLTVLTLLVMVARPASVPGLDLAVSILMLPVEVFAIYSLFRADANRWFSY